jgi:hypothetical protein
VDGQGGEVTNNKGPQEPNRLYGGPPVKPKRFLVFLYKKDHPAGGWRDLGASYDTPQQARGEAEDWEGQSRLNAAHVVDLETGEIMPKEQ